jgi:uncharacterized membrane protein YkvA (DUF1232 family)
MGKNRSFISIIRNIPLVFRYLFDPEVPFTKKLFILAGLAYFLSPVDLIPDPILGFGFLDDVGILFLILMKLADQLEAYVNKNKKENKGKGDGDVVDIEFEILDDEEQQK